MANTPIPVLPLAIILDGTEEMELVQPPGSGGTSKKVTTKQIAGLANVPGTILGAESIFGNPSNTSNVGTSIVSAPSQALLTNAAGTLSFGSINLASAVITGLLAVGLGGTGTAVPTPNGVLLGNGASALSAVAPVTSGWVLTANGTGAPPTYAQISLTTALVTGVIAVINGGTSTSALTAFGVVVGNGTSAVGVTAPGTAGQVLVGQTATSNPQFETVVGDLSLTVSGTATIANNAVTFGKFQTMVGLSVHGNSSSAVANSTAIAGTANQVLVVNPAGTGLVFGQINATAAISGIVPVSSGGTGTSALTANALLAGSGTSAVTLVSAGSAGQILVGQTTTSNPSFQTVVGDLTVAANGSAVIAANAVTYAKFQQMPALSVHANASSAIANSTAVVGTANQSLMVNQAGTGLVFGLVNLTAAITGILPIASGGTNASVAATAIVNLGGLALATTGQAFSGGVVLTTLSLGTAAGSTATLVAGNNPTQRVVVNGTAAFVAPSSDCEIDLLITNGASASTVSFSGYNVGSNTGDTYTTTSGSKFIFMSRTINGSSTYAWKALQ